MMRLHNLLILVVFLQTIGVSYAQETKVAAASPVANDEFSSSIAISGDWAVSGTPLHDADANNTNSGIVYVFQKSGSSWTQVAELTGNDTRDEDKFGYSVAIDGAYIIVGAQSRTEPGQPIKTGAAYIFHRSGTTWTQQAKLTATNPSQEDLFGQSVAIKGDYAIVGAHKDDDVDNSNNATDNGAVYIFHRSGTTWSQEAKILADDAAAGDQFGLTVAMTSTDYLIAGAPKNDPYGAAYIFHRSGTTWSQEAKLEPSTGQSASEFGTGVAIYGDYAAVGDPYIYSKRGRVYVFHHSGGSWAQEADFMGSGVGTYDYFGFSLALYGNNLAVGCYKGNGNASSSGTAYAFQRNGTNWDEKEKLKASDGASSDYFGYSVAIHGTTVAVGANKADVNGQNKSGSGYIYDLYSSLPVELADFRADKDGEEVKLTWQTASEHYNEGWEIQRTTARDIKNGIWETIGWMNGAGESNSKLTYSFIDKKPLAGTGYYRLKQYDFDGDFEYSKVVSVTFKNKGMTIYPNPAKDIIHLTISEKSPVLRVVIFDYSGKVMKTIQNTDGSFDISDLPQGYYLLRAERENDFQTQRFYKR